MYLRISLFVVAAALLAAHFFRAGNFLLLALCLALPLLFLHKRRWILLLLQGAAYAGAATWVWTTLQLVAERQQMGRPWTVAAIILGAVTLLTLATGLLLNSGTIRERYP